MTLAEIKAELAAIQEAVVGFVNAHPQVTTWNYGPGLKGIAEGKPREDWYAGGGE